jgi:hypothetical protein
VDWDGECEMPESGKVSGEVAQVKNHPIRVGEIETQSGSLATYFLTAERL